MKLKNYTSDSRTNVLKMSYYSALLIKDSEYCAVVQKSINYYSAMLS